MTVYKTLALTFLMILTSAGTLFGEIPDLKLGDLNFAFEGELRSRFAFFNNYDMDYDIWGAELATDMRAQFSIDITTGSPLYFNILFELGNIQFDEDLKVSDFYLIELKEIYGGYDWDYVEGKLGIVELKTPGSSVFEDDVLGVQAKVDFDFLQAKGFIALPNLIEDSYEVIDEISNLSILLFAGVNQNKYVDSDLWAMFLWDNSPEDFYYYSLWTGLELKKEIGAFSGDFEFVYNSGAATYLGIPIQAYYSHLTLEMEATKDMNLFSRFNLTSGSDGSDETINQFQVVNGEGNLDTGLGLLFGGSTFSNQSYFSSESLSIVEDELSSGDFFFNDPGLFIYEIGSAFDFPTLPLETEFVIGGANTGELFKGDGYFTSLIGWEVDAHNKIELSESVEFNLSFSYLIPGSSFNAVYELNTGNTLDLDTSFKTDMSIRYNY